MGKGTSDSNQTQVQQTTPYGPAQASLSGILGNVGSINPALTGTETGALNQLSTNAGNGPSQFAPGITGTANNLLAGGGANNTNPMINDAYAQYQKAMNPYASGDMSGINSPQMQAVLAQIQNDVKMNVGGAFAANGRDGSGYDQRSQSEGIASGEAVPLLSQMNTDTQNRLGAITGMFGAGGTTAGMLGTNQQNFNNNQQAGITAADAATTAQNYGPLQQLQIEAQRRGIPLQTMAQQMGIVLPAAQAFGTTTGNTTGTQTMSPVQQFGAVTTGLGNLLGGGAKAYTASDWNVKENKSQIGKLYDGTPVWSFNYIGDETPRVGLMAQEVEQRRPDAVAEFGGIKAVDYGRATEKARAIGGILGNLGAA